MPQHPAIALLHDYSRRFPGIWDTLSDELLELRRGGFSWPAYSFGPFGLAKKFLHPHEDPFPYAKLKDASSLQMLAAWRPTQGIYRFHEALRLALWEMPVEGDIPVEVLRRLPQWAVYVELPDVEMGSLGTVQGFFTMLEFDPRNGSEWMVLETVSTTGTSSIGLPLRHTFRESIDGLVASGHRRVQRTHGDEIAEDVAHSYAQRAQDAMPLWNLVLFLCSEHPGIRGTGQAEEPKRAAWRKNKRRKLVLPAAKRTTLWSVGEEIGQTLEAVERGDSQDGRTSPRPHVRRAHWHTYWLGARDSADRQPVLRWIPPLIIGGVEPRQAEDHADL